jgi:hypothetical protein
MNDIVGKSRQRKLAPGKYDFNLICRGEFLDAPEDVARPFVT